MGACQRALSGLLVGPNGTIRDTKEAPMGSLEGPKKKDRIKCGAPEGSGKRPYLDPIGAP
jgi:hypothetical protein